MSKLIGRSPGFSLLEMAIVLAIVGLLLAGLLPTITAQVEQQNRRETLKLLEEVKESLLGFSISNGHLPCPASNVSGIEDRDEITLACNSRVGYLPWATLGVNQVDGWGHLLRYSATLGFSTASGVFSLDTFRDISIQKLDATKLTTAGDIPAVILSHGANGLYGALANGNTLTSGASNSFNNVAKQSANVNGVTISGNLTFYSADHTARTASSDEEFDDLVVWLSPNVLFNRMVTAGRLP